MDVAGQRLAVELSPERLFSSCEHVREAFSGMSCGVGENESISC